MPAKKLLGLSGSRRERRDGEARSGKNSARLGKVRRKDTSVVRVPARLVRKAGKPDRLSYDDLINAEAELGRTIFGPIPEGHQREFFAYRKNVWIWHESYIDVAGVEQELTVRYEVRPAGVFKRVVGGGYEKIEGAELNNFRLAAQNYFKLVKTQLYS